MIVNSAILKDGVIYTGRRHCDIFNSAVPLGSLKGGEQGFITDEGKFVDRIEGARIAIECGQIIKLQWKPNLYSEDLW